MFVTLMISHLVHYALVTMNVLGFMAIVLYVCTQTLIKFQISNFKVYKDGDSEGYVYPIMS